MSLFRAVPPTLLTASLVLTGVAPVAAGSAEEEPVTVVALTSADGSRTGLAEEGLEALEQRARSMRTQSVPDTADVAVLTAPIATEEFYVAGVTWDGADALPQDAAVHIRVMEAGQWQDWAQLEVEASADQPGATGGTEPYIAAGAEAVQVQVTGDARELPAGLRLSLTPEWPSEEEVVLEEEAPATDVAPDGSIAPAPEAPPVYQQPSARTATAPAAEGAAAAAVQAAAQVARPTITSRAGWGANESQMTWRPSYATLRGSVIHHTAGTNNYTKAQTASVVRGIYHYHAVTRGWGDIGYNFLIDKWGRIFEGRSGSLTAPAGTMPVGAHAAPYNTGTVGLSVMGDYTKVDVTNASMNAMADVLAWQFGRAGLDPTARFVPASSSPATQRPLARVFGHRDVSATACPGNDIYSQLGWLARAANERIDDAPPAASPAPAPKPRPTDTLSHTASVFLSNTWGPVSDIDFTLGNRSTEVFTGDWDGDGEDTLALRVGSTFYVYNSNRTGAEAWIISYGRPDDEVYVGDWDGDGRDSFAVRRGKTFYPKNSITAGDADYVFRYGRAGDEVYVGDWDADGTSTFAVRRKSTFHVKNSISGGEADSVATYGRARDTVLVGDWDGDGSDTFGVRRGITYHVKNTIAGGDADIVQTYGRAKDAVLVGDWDGDGTDTLGVHRP